MGCAVRTLSNGNEKNVMMGMIAGALGGLVASWVMNAFIEGTGQRLQQAIQRERETAEPVDPSRTPPDDATMKTADAIVQTFTGGRHLSREGKKVGGPIVHYAFGTLMGACYGALAETTPEVTDGFGTAFGAALFAGADLVAVPALDLSGSPDQQSISSLTTPLAAHLVYGMTTEAIRKVVRGRFSEKRPRQ
jgi:putative membrane protein